MFSKKKHKNVIYVCMYDKPVWELNGQNMGVLEIGLDFKHLAFSIWPYRWLI